jgi:hypothetical protein
MPKFCFAGLRTESAQRRAMVCTAEELGFDFAAGATDFYLHGVHVDSGAHYASPPMANDVPLPRA